MCLILNNSSPQIIQTYPHIYPLGALPHFSVSDATNVRAWHGPLRGRAAAMDRATDATQQGPDQFGPAHLSNCGVFL